MAFEVSYEDFLEDWQTGLISEVSGTGNRLFGKSYKGQADKPQGYIIVYTVIP